MMGEVWKQLMRYAFTIGLVVILSSVSREITEGYNQWLEMGE